MSPFEAAIGRDYDCISSAITCRVDRGGASIHTVEIPSGSTSREVRVLAHNQEDAQMAAVRFIDGDESGENLDGILF